MRQKGYGKLSYTAPTRYTFGDTALSFCLNPEFKHPGCSPDEIHADLERTPTGLTNRIRECAEADIEVFLQWTAPSNFKIELFVIRVGDWGGYMMVDCDDPLAVHKVCSMLPAFVFEARPVIPVMDAVRVKQEAITFRDELKNK